MAADAVGPLYDLPAAAAEPRADIARGDQLVDLALLLGAIIDQFRTTLECHIAHAVFDTQAHARIAAEVLIFDETPHRVQHHDVGAFDKSIPHHC